MSQRTQMLTAAAAIAVCFTGVAMTAAQSPAAKALSKSEQLLGEAAQSGKYSFIVFYKQNNSATQAMAKSIQHTVAERSGEATAAYVRITDPAEQALVTKYDVARAPMPLTVAVAPNGAITGVFAQKVAPAKIANAFVTPTMMFTMKSLQEGKLVLVSVQGSAEDAASPAVLQLQADPEFRGRVASTSMNIADPHEEKFARQMKLDPRATGTSTVVIAPPGVLIGNFAANATKEEIATALAKAGKCCDDPNCERRK